LLVEHWTRSVALRRAFSVDRRRQKSMHTSDNERTSQPTESLRAVTSGQHDTTTPQRNERQKITVTAHRQLTDALADSECGGE